MGAVMRHQKRARTGGRDGEDDEDMEEGMMPKVRDHIVKMERVYTEETDNEEDYTQIRNMVEKDQQGLAMWM